MPVIKRYPNRKLYDTDAKRYITLEGVAELIRKGEEVQVVDNVTGEDLTALTLSQIIFEQEKRQSGFLPRSVLSSLIQAGGDRIGALQRTLAASIGFWHQIDEEIRRRIQSLVSQGELTEGEGQGLLEKLIDVRFRPGEYNRARSEEVTLSVQELEKYLKEHQVPSRDDLQRLIDQLDALTAELEEVRKART